MHRDRDEARGPGDQGYNGGTVMDEQMIRAALEIDAVPILPRDCDGGLVDLAAEAAGYDPDERIGIADDEQDNAAMISRDLAALAFRVLSMPITDDFGINEKAVLAEMIRKAERYADGR